MAEQMGPVFITGAQGVIGAPLVAACQQRGQKAIAGQRRDLGQKTDQLTAVAYDLMSASSLDLALTQHRPKVVIHAAAYGADGKGDALATVADNVSGFVALLEACRKHDVERVVFLGSAQAYGVSSEPHHETEKLQPRNPYGLAKKLCADIATYYNSLSGMRVTECRLFNIYGANDRLPRLIPFLLQQAKGHLPITLATGSGVRDFVHIFDAITIILAAADGLIVDDVINVATGQGTSVRQIAEMVVRFCESQSSIIAPSGAGSDTSADTLIGSLQRLQSYDLVPKIKIADGLRLVCADIAKGQVAS